MGRVLENYLAFKRGELRARSFVEIERHLLRNAAPLHSLPVSKITRRNIAGCISTIAAAKSGTSANRLRAALSAFFHGPFSKDYSTLIQLLAAPAGTSDRVREH